MLVDANLLLFAVYRRSPVHDRARQWLEQQLSGPRRVGLPWQSLGGFLRIATELRAFDRPLSPHGAWQRVVDWLGSPVAWVPQPGHRFPQILGELLVRHEVRGALIPDAQLAALAIEHGLTIYSADTDFARFSEVRWENPLAPDAS